MHHYTGAIYSMNRMSDNGGAVMYVYVCNYETVHPRICIISLAWCDSIENIVEDISIYSNVFISLKITVYPLFLRKKR